jgi:predicted metalloprotease
MNRRLRILTVAAAVVGLVSTTGPGVGAINPAQTTASGVLYYIARGDVYGSVDDFWYRNFQTWGNTYYRPPVYWYNVNGNHYQTPCGNTSSYPNNGFYCSGNHAIYLDYQYMQRLINGFQNTSGDFAMGGFVAHEWGHAINRLLYPTYYGGKRGEFYADCLAGMYTRYGYATGRLVGSDYNEFYRWLYYQPCSSTHGCGTQRASWYQYGYQQYNLRSCNNALVSGGRGSRRQGIPWSEVDWGITGRPLTVR